MAMLTQNRLRYLLSYEKSTGTFTWLIDRGGVAKAGTKAGSIAKSGHRVICIDGRRYKAARIAILWVTGKFPKRMADHRDGNASNDAWGNIRPATRSQNGANRKLNRNSGTGFKGVSYSQKDKRYSARLQKDGRSQWLGYFQTAEAAHAAYQVAAQAYFQEFSRFK